MEDSDVDIISWETMTWDKAASSSPCVSKPDGQLVFTSVSVSQKDKQQRRIFAFVSRKNIQNDGIKYSVYLPVNSDLIHYSFTSVEKSWYFVLIYLLFIQKVTVF